LQIHRHIPKIAAIAAAAAAVVGATATGSASAAGSISGAGSTLVQPFVQNVWGPDFQKSTGTSVAYSGVGSGAGIASISAKSVDFGASDAPMTSTQDSGCSGCVEIPWALGATGFSYNLSGVSHLNLTGPIIADIYLGKITNWNDPAITKLNKGETLPNEKITPVYRSDGSGDTYAFTSYLSKVSPQWKSQVGFATSVSWPAGVGVGGKGNPGVAAIVSSTPGAIGNNSSFYIHQVGLHAVAVQNNAGNFVYAYPTNVADAANAVLKKVPNLSSLSPSTADTIASAMSIVNCAYQKPKKGQKPTTLQKEEAQAYPLSTFTYVIVSPSSANLATVQQFIKFAITPAEQQKGLALGFSTLTKAVAAADTKAVNGL
jgi:phosphate transport system substrate-binding protein